MKAEVAHCRTIVAGLLVIALLALTQGRTPAVAEKPPAPGPAGPLVLDEAYHSQTVDAFVGQSVIISLEDPAWAWGPYGWDVQEIRGDALKLTGRTDNAPGGWSVEEPGAPARSHFRLEAAQTGEATVLLICNPPRGLMVPTYFYEVTIRVWLRM